jgi:hypothetical protein
VHLAEALLGAARERRRREWATLERLLGLLPGGDGDLAERFKSLSGRQLGEAARAVIDLGWIDR